MTDDQIIEEIRSIRGIHAARYGNDLDRILVAIKEREKTHSYKLINRELVEQSEHQAKIEFATGVEP